MSRFPLTVSIAFGQNATTGATPNVAANATAVAAPGVGFRLRVWGLSASGRPINTGKFMAWLQDATSILLGYVTDTGSTAIYPPGGVPMGDNTALLIGFVSNVASQKFDWQVIYTIEPTA